MQVLQSLWGLQGVKWHTFQFLMEGFWPLECTPSSLVLKSGEKCYVSGIIKTKNVKFYLAVRTCLEQSLFLGVLQQQC